MHKHGTMVILRMSAAFLVFGYGAGLVLAQPALARFSGCSPANGYGCITRHSAYEDKACTAEGEPEEAVHCVTCSTEPEHICTWCGEDLEGYFNSSTFPPCDSIPE